MAFQTSSPPPPVLRSDLVTRTAAAWNQVPSRPVYGDGAPAFNVSGSNSGTVGYQTFGGVELSGITLEPPAGATQQVRLEGVNGTQRFAALFVQAMQTTVNPMPGRRWRMVYRMPVAGTLVPNAAGTDTQLLVGFASDFGFVFGRPRGPGVWLSVLGDNLPNWRVWAIDGDLNSGGAVTVDQDTGVALSGAPQSLEWICGNLTGENFLEARIDGVTVFSPSIPLAALYPTAETSINLQAGVLRGGDAADVAQLLVLDDAGPSVFYEEFPA